MTEVYATPQTQTAARPGGSAPSLGARPILSVRQIEKVYGNRDSVTRAINDISFDVAPGEFVGIMGPSGSGKTTLLNCVATIDTVTSGHILVDGRDITGLRSRAWRSSVATTWLHLPGFQPAWTRSPASRTSRWR